MQALRLDGEPEQFVFIRFDHARQIGGVQIVGRERIIGGADAVLQRQIEAGRGFARTGHAHQNHVGFFQIAVRHAVVVVQGKVHRFHARVVFFDIVHAALHGMPRTHAQFAFQFAQKRIEIAQMQALRGFDDFAHFVVGNTGKNQRPYARFFCRFVDDVHQGVRFFLRVDKGIGGAFEFDAVKLFQ